MSYRNQQLTKFVTENLKYFDANSTKFFTLLPPSYIRLAQCFQQLCRTMLSCYRSKKGDGIPKAPWRSPHRPYHRSGPLHQIRSAVQVSLPFKMRPVIDGNLRRARSGEIGQHVGVINGTPASRPLLVLTKTESRTREHLCNLRGNNICTVDVERLLHFVACQ